MAEADGSASSSDASPEAPPAVRGDDGRGEGELGRVRSGPSRFATTLDAADAAVRARSSCFFSRRTRCFAARRAAREEEPPPATRGGLAAVPSRRATMYVRTDACDGSCAARQACATRFVGKLGRDCTLCHSAPPKPECPSLVVRSRRQNRPRPREVITPEDAALGNGRRRPRRSPQDLGRGGEPRRPRVRCATSVHAAPVASPPTTTYPPPLRRVCRAAPDLRALPDILRASLPLPRFLLSRSRLRLRRHAGGHDGRVLRGGPEDL